MKIAFIGDVMLGRLVNEMLKSNKPDFPWGNTLAILQKAMPEAWIPSTMLY